MAENYLTIISDPKKGGSGTGKIVMASCVCGSIGSYRLRFIKSGHTTSCGCKLKTHGLTKHPLFKVWQSMKERCYNANHHAFKDYGGRGIIMCNEWLLPEIFINWALGNGYRTGLEIDRIDNSLGYNPLNCRFTTRKQNSRNRRNTIKLKYNGDEKPLTEWAEIYKIEPITLRYRIKRGYSMYDALNKPIDKRRLECK